MTSRGDVWAAVSQDYDSLLFGAIRLVRNLAITGKRKLPMREAYVQVDPEMVELEKTLDALELTREQLIDLGILIGTDFNPDGFKGIGPKTALRLLRESGNIETIAQKNPNVNPPTNLNRIRQIFLKPDVTSHYTLHWREPQTEELVRFLCGERDFNEERVRTAVERAKSAMTKESRTQTLESFFHP